MTTVGTADVTLVKENEDGSAVYQFNFPPEVMEALTRLGILTAIEAGIGEAKKLHPDYEEHMTERINELFEQALDETVPETWTTLNHAQVLRLKEKFAKLIVRECAMEAIDEVAFQGGSVAIEAGIKQRLYTHFGIEE